MRITRLFINLGLVLALGALLLPASVFATGTDEPESPDQSQESETPEEPSNTDDNSSNGASIGGGLNTDTVEQPPVADVKPSTPSISDTLPQPSDPDTETKQPTPTKPTTPAPKPTLPVVTPKPQTSSKPSITTAPVASTATDIDSDSAETLATTIIPTAPNDSIAPTEIETPHTGIIETPSAPANPFAIILLILAGITILAAGIVSTLLSRAAQRHQSIIRA